MVKEQNLITANTHNGSTMKTLLRRLATTVTLGTIAVVTITGCSGNASTTATSATSSQANGAVSDATTSAGPSRLSNCEDLMREVTWFQEEQFTRPERWASRLSRVYGEKVGTSGDALYGTPESLWHIGREAAADPHSATVKQEVREYCGTDFDQAYANMKRSRFASWQKQGFTPDWSN